MIFICVLFFIFNRVDYCLFIYNVIFGTYLAKSTFIYMTKCSKSMITKKKEIERLRSLCTCFYFISHLHIGLFSHAALLRVREVSRSLPFFFHLYKFKYSIDKIWFVNQFINIVITLLSWFFVVFQDRFFVFHQCSLC